MVGGAGTRVSERTGGRKGVSAWRVVLAAAGAQAVAYGLARFAFGLFLPDVRAELGLSTAVLGVIASGSYVGFTAAAVLATVLAGRTGPRLPVVVGGVSAAVGMLGIASAHGAGMLAIAVVLAGSGAGWVWPPMADAVRQLLAPDKRSRSLAAINAGPSVGVLLSGPLALLAGGDWRLVWLGFAAAALLVTGWNARLLPSGSDPTQRGGLPKLSWSWFVCPRSRPLLLAAFLVGLANAVYWTFAVDLVASGGALPVAAGPVFWTVVGVAGLGGALAGDLVERFGLRRSFVLTVTGLGLSTALLGGVSGGWPAPFVWAVTLISAVLFGPTVLGVTAILALWATDVFAERPSAGTGAVLLLTGAGQLLGPTIFGLLANATNLHAAFLAAAALCLAAAAIRPATSARRSAERAAAGS